MKIVDFIYGILPLFIWALQLSGGTATSFPEFNCLPETEQNYYKENIELRTSQETKNEDCPNQSSYGGHPLDQLGANEIEKAKRIINYCFPSPNGWLFNTITLKEPPKHLIAPYFYKNEDPPQGTIPREALCIIRQPKAPNFIELVLNLEDEAKAIVSKKILGNDSIAIYTVEEIQYGHKLIKSHPEFLLRIKNLGYTAETVFLTPWSMGYVGDDARYFGKRLYQMFVYGMKIFEENVYAHPFPFLVIVDLIQQSVIEFVEVPCTDDFHVNNSGITIPDLTANYDRRFQSNDFYRDDLKPINISFPHGPSYTVMGNLIKWQKFSFRIGFNYREGLVIHLVSYNDSGRIRPLIYRASLSELWIPYGDPRFNPGPRKNVFDEGEYGLGYSVSELNINEDCIGGGIHDIAFFDGIMNDEAGNPKIAKRAICVREQDAGVLWRHTDQFSERVSMSRSRRLAVTFLVRAANYEYYFHWYFYQDASIQFETQFTGIVSTNLLALGSPTPPYASKLSDQVLAQYHQHFLCARIDTDIDGPKNTVHTVDMVAPSDAPPGTPHNYYGNAIIAHQVRLNTTKEGATNTSPSSARNWKITNDGSLHPVTNKPVGYSLKPANSPPVVWTENSPGLDRARFVTRSMWVTPHKDGEFFAGGDYLNAQGVAQSVEKDPHVNIVDEDIVLWHTFGATHNPRIEDWPIMPVESTGFWLKPYYFFKQNPALDVPLHTGNVNV